MRRKCRPCPCCVLPHDPAICVCMVSRDSSWQPFFGHKDEYLLSKANAVWKVEAELSRCTVLLTWKQACAIILVLKCQHLADSDVLDMSAATVSASAVPPDLPDEKQMTSKVCFLACPYLNCNFIDVIREKGLKAIDECAFHRHRLKHMLRHILKILLPCCLAIWRIFRMTLKFCQVHNYVHYGLGKL